MLIYIFWHWPSEQAGYEDGLRAFHAALARAAVPGFLNSAAYHVRGPAWLPQGGGYEDWYLVESFEALGVLNEAAVAPALRQQHDRPARLVEGGTAGLYAVHTGVPDLDAERVSWLSKPAGTGYDDFYASLPATPALLRRQLVLGPGHEFCAMSALPGARLAQRDRLV